MLKIAILNNLYKIGDEYLNPFYDKLPKNKLGFLEFTSVEELRDFISENLIEKPIIEDLNLSKVEKEKNIKVDDGNRSKFLLTSRFENTPKDFDFIDLGALIMNITMELWKDCTIV